MLALIAAAALAALPAPATGDFDGDGRIDTARLVERTNGPGYDLVITRGSGAAPIVVTHVSEAGNFYVHSGRYRVACVELAGKTSKPCPVTRRAPKDVVMFGTEEASAAMAIWNGQGFDVEWVSD
jgi:hypothetical protein